MKTPPKPSMKELDKLRGCFESLYFYMNTGDRMVDKEIVERLDEGIANLKSVLKAELVKGAKYYTVEKYIGGVRNPDYPKSKEAVPLDYLEEILGQNKSELDLDDYGDKIYKGM